MEYIRLIYFDYFYCCFKIIGGKTFQAIILIFGRSYFVYWDINLSECKDVCLLFDHCKLIWLVTLETLKVRHSGYAPRGPWRHLRWGVRRCWIWPRPLFSNSILNRKVKKFSEVFFLEERGYFSWGIKNKLSQDLYCKGELSQFSG